MNIQSILQSFNIEKAEKAVEIIEKVIACLKGDSPDDLTITGIPDDRASELIQSIVTKAQQNRIRIEHLEYAKNLVAVLVTGV